EAGIELSPVAVIGGAKDLGNGHAVVEYQAPWGRPTAKWSPLFGLDSRPEIEELRARLRRTYGDERGGRMADYNRNMVIFPNLVINDVMAVTIRTIWPAGAGRLTARAWEFAPATKS